MIKNEALTYYLDMEERNFPFSPQIMKRNHYGYPIVEQLYNN